MNNVSQDKYDLGLEKGDANYQPLTPLTFLAWAELTYPDKPAVIEGDLVFTYRDFATRCRKLAGALSVNGVGKNSTVSVMAPNIHAMLEAHYAVPMSGGVLNALNYRLDAKTIAFILNHAETEVLLTAKQFSGVISEALVYVKRDILVIDIDDDSEGTRLLGDITYEEFLSQGDANICDTTINDEWDAISLNYTSGTTGNPKGVVYHHRGAFLNALGNVISFALNSDTVYLWTLPMFHCNGWTYPWAVTAVGGTHVCLPKLEPSAVFSLIEEHDVSHMCGAPVVLNMLVHAGKTDKAQREKPVNIATGGASPPSSVIKKMEQLGFRLTHLNALTESYGPATSCAWQRDWDSLSLDDQALKLSRQGVRFATVEDVQVLDPSSYMAVPADSTTLGEIMIRGNTVMKGYLKNNQATEAAFHNGWFHSGDLAVVHSDQYIEIKDRSKDVIISGGENISSLEIEETLYRHPDVMEAAVVAKPDQQWGEVPCAFVTLIHDHHEITDKDIIKWCRDNMAHYKIPKYVVFCDLPKTSTGKVQKFALRKLASEM